MSNLLRPGVHPDADSLNAFLEGVLPEHERAQCLAHLAECSECREAVFLAQETPPLEVSAPAPAPAPEPFWKRWFAPMPVLAAAAAVVVAVAAGLHWGQSAPTVPAVETAARTSPVAPSPALPPPVEPKPETEPRRERPVQKKASARVFTNPPARPLSQVPPLLAEAPVLAPVPAPAPIPLPQLSAVREAPAPVGPGGISGTVVDASGAVIAGAVVRLVQSDGTHTAEGKTDAAGQFHFLDLPPGRYQLLIDSPGFRQGRSEVEVQPRQLASLNQQLEVGSVAETVEVTAAPATIETQTSSTSTRAPRPLPSKLPAVDSITSGKRMLALDSAGTLFVSQNSGRRWKRVKPVWVSKIREIDIAGAATFQLTTESDAVYISRDGSRWQAVEK